MNTLGADGEEAAARYLAERGCTIVARGYTAKTGEIDLIVLDGGTLAFVEVKDRAKDGFGGPAEAVTRGKQIKIARTAARYLQDLKGPLPPCRFDVVAILDGRIEHIKDAFPSPIRFTL